MKTNEKSSKSKIKSPINDIDDKKLMDYKKEFLELVLKTFQDPSYPPVKGLKDPQKKEDIKKYIEKSFLRILRDLSHRISYISPKLSDMENAKEEQKEIKKYLKATNLDALVTKLTEKRHWIVEKDPDLKYKFTPVSISETGCFILPDGTKQKKLAIGLIIKLDSQDLHYRYWHNILVRKQSETPSASTKHRLREELNPWITSKIEPESYWFSDLYKVEVKSKSKKEWSLPCFTLYISKSHFTPEKNQRFIKFNRHLRRAQKSALEILNEQYKAELNIIEKNPRLKYRGHQWEKALDSIRRALSRSIDGWRIDDAEKPELFTASVCLDGDILANGDFISGHITFRQEGKPDQPLVRYIVIIKNEDLIDGCESREKFLSERYAALISLIDRNKDDDDELPVFDGLIEVFSLQDKRKDLWKRHLNLTEFHPDQRYNPISLLIEMGGDVFYEPILVNNEKAYSAFFDEMIAANNSKKNTDK
jgi:hypothetical protein